MAKTTVKNPTPLFLRKRLTKEEFDLLLARPHYNPVEPYEDDERAFLEAVSRVKHIGFGRMLTLLSAAWARECAKDSEVYKNPRDFIEKYMGQKE